jgi:hypothetical protein
MIDGFSMDKQTDFSYSTALSHLHLPCERKRKGLTKLLDALSNVLTVICLDCSWA